MKKLYSMVLMLLMVNGCATHNIQSTYIDKNKPLSPGHGIVAAQVINNTDRLAPLHKGWTEVLAVRTDNMEALKQKALAEAQAKGKKVTIDTVDWEPDAFSLRALQEGVIDSQLFVGSMPEGTYMLATLYSFYSDGNMSSWVSMPVYNSAGKFTVKNAEVTDLGSVVFQPLLSIKEKSFWSSQSSTKAYVTRLDDKQQLGKFILSHYPVIARDIEAGVTNGWQGDELDDFRKKLGTLSRTNAYGASAISLNGLARGVLLARFGQIRVLNQDQQWLQIDLPTNSQPSAVLETKQGVLIGAERGQLFWNTDWQVTGWQLKYPVAAKEAIVWMGKNQQNYFAVTSSAMNYKVYQFAGLDSDWQKIGEFKKKPKNSWLVQNGGLFPIVKDDGSLRLLNDDKVYDYIADTKQWKMQKGEAMVKVSQLSNGTLVGLEVSQWDGVGDQVLSTDNGNSWSDITRNLGFFGDAKSESSLPVVTQQGHLFTVGRVRKNKQKSELRILSAKSHSGKWQTHGLAKEACLTMLPELSSNERLYFLCDQGQVVSTSDKGESWQTEITIDIAAMEQEYENLLKAIKDRDK